VAEEQKKAYTLKPGAKHTADGKVYKDGETVMLTETQAAAFKDKFVQTAAPAGLTATHPVQPEPKNDPVPTAPAPTK
jgi:hypothetical protein